MPRGSWAMRLWPGLVPLWQRGSFSGLFLAVVFSLLLNLTLATTWIWTEMVHPGVRLSAWGVVAAIWVTSAWAAGGWGRPDRQPPEPSPTAQFQIALTDYLQGKWLEAEQQLRRLLSRNSRDLEARLLLATLFRRTGRVGEAREQLARLATLDGSDRWTWEIGRELEQLGSTTVSDVSRNGDMGMNSEPKLLRPAA